MEHLFKQSSLQEIVRYNKYLLITSALLALALLISTISLVTKEEKWVLVPALEPDRRMIISSKTYNETYLREWAIFVMKELFTTSPEEVEKQVADMKVISRNSPSLEKFFEEHLKFVKGSNVSSVFFPKKVKIIKEGVIVEGTFRYWFGASKDFASEKSYILEFKRGKNGLLLLTNVEEQKQ
ncbi:MAG TPA: type IV conjugative transfer system protein TraE [Rickettsia endosymbiont of Omalisus fontisbellaquei]|nr:type IV conjugative transfer system protein TraE [Rickettsia endosymbiont of Omalisus fontisbellaquei]